MVRTLPACMIKLLHTGATTAWHHTFQKYLLTPAAHYTDSQSGAGKPCIKTDVYLGTYPEAEETTSVIRDIEKPQLIQNYRVSVSRTQRGIWARLLWMREFQERKEVQFRKLLTNWWTDANSLHPPVADRGPGQRLWLSGLLLTLIHSIRSQACFQLRLEEPYLSILNVCILPSYESGNIVSYAWV